MNAPLTITRERAQRASCVEPLFRARAPLRVTFAGGGTDVTPFLEREGGLVLSATINRYAHGTLRPRTDVRVQIESLDLDTALEYHSAGAGPIRRPPRPRQGRDPARRATR